MRIIRIFWIYIGRVSLVNKSFLHPFPTQNHSIRPCYALEMLELWLFLKKQLGRHMNYSRQDRNGRQSRSCPEFGLTRWNLFKHLLFLYGCDISIHKREEYRRQTQAKENMKLVTQRYKVTIKIIRFQYPSELKLLVSLFGENSLKGNRYKNPSLSDPVKNVVDGDDRRWILHNTRMHFYTDWIVAVDLCVECLWLLW